MQINITIEKKHLWLLILVVVAVGFVIAYNTDPANPSVMGHSLGEVLGQDADNDGIVDNAEKLEGKTLAEVVDPQMKVRVVECFGNCADEGSANVICSATYGQQWKATAVDCECTEVGGANQHWDRNFDSPIDWCCDTQGEDFTVTCRSS